MKRILWIVNTIFPYPAKMLKIKKTVLGGWLNGLANNIKEQKDIKLYIATVYSGKNIKKFDDGKIVYYLIPGAPAIQYDVKLEKYWKQINEECKPDLVHIHGTEFTHGLAFLTANPHVKSAVSIQGLVSKIADVYYANISINEVIKNITFRDLIKKDSLIQQKRKFCKRGKEEIKCIKKANAIIGRTEWDYSNCKTIKDNLIYYKCNEIIRDEFYKAEKWNDKNMEKHSLYISQGSYPIKGLHIILKAIATLKNEYSDIKLYVSGDNIVKAESVNERMRLSGYGKYIRNIIKKLELSENVIFTGNLNTKEVINRIQKSNAVIMASIVENESNSISEASLIGTPVICSYVGGIVDRIENGVNGLTYPFTESAMLANNIRKVFEKEELVKNITKNEIEKYSKILDKKTNVDRMLEIYNEIITQRELK